MNIEYIEKTTSTNDIIRERDSNLSLVWADKQTNGRGQRGNSWESEKGKNLTLSIMTHPTFLAAENQFILSKAISLAVVDTLLNYGISAKIKWPNDIYVGDKKICGILIECDINGSGMLQRVIIGLGLNVNQTKFVSNAPNPTSMSIATNKKFNREDILEDLAHGFENIFMMISESLYSPIHNRYFDLLYRKDGVHCYKDKDGEFKASISSITRYGALVLKRKGIDKEYQFKEVAFIL